MTNAIFLQTVSRVRTEKAQRHCANSTGIFYTWIMISATPPESKGES